MGMLKWKTEYSVGIASIDDEHREMIELINDAYAKLDGAQDEAAIEYCLEKIYSTISLHFALEERIMRDRNYDEYDDHKEDHEELLDEIRDLMDGFAADPKGGSRLLQARLSGWFGKHFAGFDARLHGKLGPH
jgi:hemerythrin